MKLLNIKFSEASKFLIIFIFLFTTMPSIAQTGFEDDVDDEAEVPVAYSPALTLTIAAAAGFFLVNKKRKTT